MRKRFAARWRYQLKYHPYQLWLLLWAICTPALLILVDHYVNTTYKKQQQQHIDAAYCRLQERNEQSHHDLTLLLTQFTSLPKHLATHHSFQQAFNQPTDAHIRAANQQLHEIAHFLSIDLITLIDTQGSCIAASNSDTPNSVVGNQLADRHYVQQALLGKPGFQYALGRSTYQPGFYFSAPTYNEFQNIIGLITIKVNVEQLVQRAHLGNTLLLNDQNKIIYAKQATWLGKDFIDATLHTNTPAANDIDALQLHTSTLVNNAQVKTLSSEEAPVLIKPLTLFTQATQLSAYLIEPIPELLPLHAQYQYIYRLSLTSSFIILAAILALLIFTRRNQLDRQEINDKNKELKQLNQQLKHQAESDFLTGCLNRRHFDKTLRELIASPERVQTLQLALYDIDYFKRVNDTYGHDIGDRALQHVCNFMRQHIDDTVILSRIGGEEFTLIFINRTLDSVHEQLEQIRLELAITPLVEESLNEPVPLTISIGLTQLLPDDNASKLLQRADHAMYHAKQQGRNQTCLL